MTAETVKEHEKQFSFESFPGNKHNVYNVWHPTASRLHVYLTLSVAYFDHKVDQVAFVGPAAFLKFQFLVNIQTFLKAHKRPRIRVTFIPSFTVGDF